MELRKRMYEQVCQGFFLPPLDTEYGQSVDVKEWNLLKKVGYLPYLQECQPFIIDDVAMEWEQTAVDLNELRLAMPYSKFWMEWQSPDGKKKRGIMIHVYPWEEAINNVWCHVQSNPVRRKQVEQWKPNVVVFNRFIQNLDAQVQGIRVLDTQKELYLDQEGRIVFGYLGIQKDRDIYDPETMPIVATFAIGILSSCSRKIQEIESTSGYAKRVSQKKGFDIVYKVLNVRPTIERRKYINSRTIDDGPKRFHDVRGHFKTYTKERPLFGKWYGQYYIRSHSRGDLSAGIIDKTYKIRT